MTIPTFHPEGRWYRLVPSQYPPVLLFEDVVNSVDYEIAYQIEAMTNDRLREQEGHLGLVPEEERVFGPGTTPIMAAFTHVGHPSRFTDGSFGVYYAGNSQECAIHESIYNRVRILQQNHSPAEIVTMRSYNTLVNTNFDDIRGADYADCRSPDVRSYPACQAFARQRKATDSNGLLYLSARYDGDCIAVFRPTALSPVTQGAHFQFHWDGEKITGWNRIGPHHVV